jgi:hypothetical protein
MSFARSRAVTISGSVANLSFGSPGLTKLDGLAQMLARLDEAACSTRTGQGSDLRRCLSGRGFSVVVMQSAE